MSKKSDVMIKILSVTAALIGLVFSSKDAKDQIIDLKDTIKQKEN